MSHIRAGVYLIACSANDRRYVGSANDIRRRWQEHRYELKHNRHDNPKLQHAWNKYGEKSFSFIILEMVDDPAKLIEREQHWLDELRPEFNVLRIASMPPNGIKREESTREKQARATKARWETLSDKERERIRRNIKTGVREFWGSLSDEEEAAFRARRSNPHTDATKEILRQKALDQHARQPAYWTGKSHSESTKAKLRAAALKQFAGRAEARTKKRIEWETGREAREQERRRKLSEANRGKRHSAETKRKLREATFRQFEDDEQRRKHQEAVLKAMRDPETLKRLSDSHKGKKLSAEQRKKIGQAHKGRKRSPEIGRRISEAKKRWWAARKASKKKSG